MTNDGDGWSGDYEDTEPAPKARKLRPSPAADEDAGPCPVRALGRRRGLYSYLSPSGELIELVAREHIHSVISSLFDGDTSWLWKRCPKRNADGVIKDWNAKWAAEVLMKAASEAGFFDPARVRGPGAWRLGGALALHLGDELLLPRAALRGAEEYYDPVPATCPEGHVRIRAGTQIDGVIYPSDKPEPRFADTPTDAAEVQALLDFLGTWRWALPPEAPRLLLGWLGGALVAGALEWRPHVWVCGSHGTGKSTLEKLIGDILGPAAKRFSNPTEAGVRQALGGAARPVLLDEMDSNADPGQAQRVVALAKLASTEHQSPVVRGSAEGRASAWFIRACIYLTSILHVSLKPEHAARITVIELMDPPQAADEREADAARKRVSQGVERFGALGPGLRARMAAGWPRFLVNLEVYKDALAAHGRTLRQAEQLGTLLAAAETLLSDDAVDPAAAREMVDAVALDDLTGHADDGDHFQCLDHLLAWTLDVAFHEPGGGRAQMAIAEIAAGARPEYPEGDGARVLRRTGIALKRAEAADGVAPELVGAACLVIANRHPGLDRIFAATRWSDGRWAQSLGRLPSAFRGPPVRFAGRKARGVWLPTVKLGVNVGGESPAEDDDRDGCGGGAVRAA